jgi:hypothetical protein
VYPGSVLRDRISLPQTGQFIRSGTEYLSVSDRSALSSASLASARAAGRSKSHRAAIGRHLEKQFAGFEFNLACIPDDFDPEYMSRLFDLGFELAVTNAAWHLAPLGGVLALDETRRAAARCIAARLLQ